MTRAGEQYVGPMVVLQDGPAAAKIAAKAVPAAAKIAAKAVAAAAGISLKLAATKCETDKSPMALG